jgi:hypothetical protein
MKIISIIPLLFLLSSCIKSDKSKQLSDYTRVEYYTNLTGIISPNLAYLGRGEISELEAENMSHYRFLYDGDQLLKIQYYNGNQPNDNSYYGAHEVRYKYLENKLIRSYHNGNGNKATTYRHYYLGNNIHQEVFELDNSNYPISMILMDSLNNQIESGIGSYVFRFEKIDDNSFLQQQFKKDGSPNILTYYFPFYRSIISTGDKGYLYSISNANDKGEIVMDEDAGYASIIFDFDEFGNELGWSFRDVSHNLSNRKNYFDMDYGFAKVVYLFDWDNKELGLHNGFEEAFFDEKNAPVENNKEIHLIKYEFDEGGQFLGMRKYDLEGAEIK